MMGNSYGSHVVPSTPIIDEQVSGDCIVMYSTTVCSFCTRAKQVLDEMNLKYRVVELDQLSSVEGGRTSQELRDKTRVLTVPQIFINGEFIGGYTEMVALQKAGSLLNKIAKCKMSCVKD